MTGQHNGARGSPECVRAAELTLPPARGGIGWPSQSSAEELALVVWIRESPQAYQISYHSDPDPGL